MRRQASHLNSAFTLIELLVVIAIIGALAALLLPTLNHAKGKGRQISCLSNLRQLSAAIHLYTADYRGLLPHSTSENDMNQPGCWFYAVDAYLLGSAPTNTPSARQKLASFKQDPIWFTFDATKRAEWRTIKMNRKLVGSRDEGTNVTEPNAHPPYRNIYTIRSHATTPLLFDGRCEEVVENAPDRQRYDGWEPYAALRHSGGANIVFVDGHVEWWNKGKPNTTGPGGWGKDTTGLSWWAEESPL
jgi:prepilin-type processing-associated H-X9-DG protein/prepilin-type N-terminal cleavage/methylation domain-containing protein